MRRRQVAAATIIVVAGAVLGVALRIEVFAGPNDRHPAATVALPAPGTTRPLYDGCNTIALTFPDGTTSETVKETVEPAAAVASIWRYRVGQGGYADFSPAAPQASHLPTVNFLDPAWICLAGATAPAQPPTPPNRFFCTDPGCVTLDGSPALPGTYITATIGGNVCGATSVKADSTYVVDVVSSGQTAGCGTEGATVDFWVAGYAAGTATWHSGYFTDLDLAATSDTDGDGVPDSVDNCPSVPNPGQQNSDSGRPPSGTGAIDNGPGLPGNDATIPNGDTMGDACDPDSDNDGLPDALDTNPLGSALAVHSPPVKALPVAVASIALPPPGAPQQVNSGCNSISLTFPDGTASETVLQAVTPTGAAQVMWGFSAALGYWQGFDSAFPQASDLSTVNFLEAAWLCTGSDVPAQPPTPPNRFFGDVTLDGSPALPGTYITATIGGNVCGATSVEADSTYVVDVVSEGNAPGCGTEGATVDFWVAGLAAGSATWHSGYFTELDLAAVNPCAAFAGADDGHPNPAGGDVTNDDDHDGDPALPTGGDTSDNGPSWDTDNDGALDGVECTLGHNPRIRTDRPSTADCGGTLDTDGDGLQNAWETCGWGTDLAVVDTDGDGKGDCKEVADVDGNGLVGFVGDTIYYAKAVLLPRASFGKTMDFDIDKNGTVDFVGDVIQEAKFALITGLCK